MNEVIDKRVNIAVTLLYNAAEVSYVIFTLTSDTCSSSVTQYFNLPQVNGCVNLAMPPFNSVANILPPCFTECYGFVTDSRLRKSGRLSVRLSSQQPQHSSADASRDDITNQRPADRSGRRRLAGYAGIHPLRLSHVHTTEQPASHRPILICVGHFRPLPLEFRPGNSLVPVPVAARSMT